MLLCLSPMQQVWIYCCSFDVRLFITIVVSNHRSSQTSASYTQPPGLRCEYLKETIINLPQSDWQYFITNHQSLIMLQLSTVLQSPKPLTLSCWSPVGPSTPVLYHHLLVQLQVTPHKQWLCPIQEKDKNARNPTFSFLKLHSIC